MTATTVARARRGDVATFDPQKAREDLAKTAALQKLAEDLRDFEAFERATDKSLDLQGDLVTWWRGHVRNGRPKKNVGSEIVFTVDRAEEVCGFSALQVSRWGKRLAKRDEYRASIVEPVRKKLLALSGSVHVSNNSGENEWYTPPEIIEAARRVMGGIDFDPASSAIANKVVAAEMYCTAENDGLKQAWRGRVWMNPPYAQPLCAQFCAAAASKAEAGEIEQACVLINNATETAWFQGLLAVASAVCFLKGRVKYLDATGTPANTPLQGQAVIYLGADARAFADEFRRMGTVLFHG